MERHRGQFGRGLMAVLLLSCLLSARSAYALSDDSARKDVAASHLATAGQLPFARYQSIIDRKPFGELAKISSAESRAVEAAEAEQQKQEQDLAKKIDMVAVNITPRGQIAVGFIDKTEKPPRNYYVRLGETAGGYTVVDADFENEIATIEKDGVTISLKLGQGLVQGKNPADEQSTAHASSTATIRPAARPVPVFRPRLARSTQQAATNSPLRASYLQRLRAKREERNREKTEEISQLREEIGKIAHSSEEAAKKRERAINLELISRGQQPLSEIQLTPEEDAELVRKGVLTEE